MSTHAPAAAQPPVTLGGRVSNTLSVNDIRACLGIFVAEDSAVHALEIATNSTDGSSLVLGVWDPASSSVAPYLTVTSDGGTLSGPVTGTSAVFSSSVSAGTFFDGTLTINSGNISTANVIAANSFTDNTLTITGGSVQDAVSVQASTLTDGTLVISSGNITGAGSVAAGTLTDGTATLAGGSLSGLVNVSLSGTLTAGTLSVDTFESSSLEVTEGGALYYGEPNSTGSWRVFHDVADGNRLKTQFHDGTAYVTQDYLTPGV